MRKFALYCSLTTLVGLALYLLIIGALTPNLNSFKSYNVPTSNNSLNESLNRAQIKRNTNLILGSSTALCNIRSCQIQEACNQHWYTVGGFGLDPRNTHELIKHLDAQNIRILIPLSIVDLPHLNSPLRAEEFQKLNPITLKSTIKLNKIRDKELPRGHVSFDQCGSASLIQKGTEDPLKSYTINPVEMEHFFESTQILADEKNLQIDILLFPFSAKYGQIDVRNIRELSAVDYTSQNVRFYNLLPTQMDSNNFNDVVHMNVSGASSITNTIISKVLQCQ